MNGVEIDSYTLEHTNQKHGGGGTKMMGYFLYKDFI